MTIPTAAIWVTGLGAAVCFAVMAFFLKGAVLQKSPDVIQPNAVWSYTNAQLADFAQAIVAENRVEAFRAEVKYWDSAFVILFVAFCCLVAIKAFGAVGFVVLPIFVAYAVADFGENILHLRAVAGYGPAGAPDEPALASRFTTAKFLLLVPIGALNLYGIWTLVQARLQG